MPDSFGARLRQRREEQKIDLIAIAEGTKIKRSLLDALERDDISGWPCGIYRRAYIRAYARAIALDPDVVLREFLTVHPEPSEVVTTEAIASVVDGVRTNGGGPPTRLRNIMGSAFGSLSRLRRGGTIEDPAVVESIAAPVADPATAQLLALESIRRAAVGAGPSPRLDPAGQLGRSRTMSEATASEPIAVKTPPEFSPDLPAVARFCTELGRVNDAAGVQRLLQEAAGILEATGLIVWIWDASAGGLTPVLAHGYSPRVLAQLPAVTREADNPTAAAFRSGEVCAITGSENASGAIVVPLLTPGGCAGVLAIELQHGREQSRSVCAVATIMAALLAQLVGATQSAELQPHAAPGRRVAQQ